MKYAIIKCINGHYFIHAEGITDVTKAKANYHALCETLWNAKDVITAKVMLADENLNVVEGYTEFIHHEENADLG
jgi:glutaminase